jgi:hypothetical protein
MKQKKSRVSVSISPEIKEELEAFAREHSMSVSKASAVLLAKALRKKTNIALSQRNVVPELNLQLYQEFGALKEQLEAAETITEPQYSRLEALLRDVQFDLVGLKRWP